MIQAILLIATGAGIALYFTNEPFRKKVNDLAVHVVDLFRKKETEVVPPAVEPSTPK